MLTQAQCNDVSGGADRRRELRCPIPSGVKVQLQLPTPMGTVDADLADMSRNGIGLLTRAAIAPGTLLTFEFGLNQVSAVVCHCRGIAGGFMVGLLIRDSQPAATAASL